MVFSIFEDLLTLLSYYNFIKKNEGQWRFVEAQIGASEEFLSSYSPLFDKSKLAEMLTRSAIENAKEIFYLDIKDMYFSGIYIDDGKDSYIYILDSKFEEFAEPGDTIVIEAVYDEIERLIKIGEEKSKNGNLIGGFNGSSNNNNIIVGISVVILILGFSKVIKGKW